jgi:hypothetical protein
MLFWKSHRDQHLAKPGAACYPIKSSKSFTTQETSVIYAYFHLIMHYGIILCGNSPYYTNIFRLKKKKELLPVLGIRGSCRDLIKTTNILPHQSQYIFLLLCFAVMNMDK